MNPQHTRACHRALERAVLAVTHPEQQLEPLPILIGLLDEPLALARRAIQNLGGNPLLVRQYAVDRLRQLPPRENSGVVAGLYITALQEHGDAPLSTADLLYFLCQDKQVQAVLLTAGLQPEAVGQAALAANDFAAEGIPEPSHGSEEFDWEIALQDLSNPCTEMRTIRLGQIMTILSLTRLKRILDDSHPPAPVRRIAPLVADLLTDPDEQVRSQAAMTLGQLDESAYPYLSLLIRALKDQPEVRDGAIEAIQQLEAWEHISDDLLKYLSTNLSESTSILVARECWRRHACPQTALQATELLGDNLWESAWGVDAIELLGEIGSHDPELVLPILLHQLQQLTEEAEPQVLIDALTQVFLAIGSIEALEEYLQSENETVRQAAEQVISNVEAEQDSDDEWADDPEGEQDEIEAGKYDESQSSMDLYSFADQLQMIQESELSGEDLWSEAIEHNPEDAQAWYFRGNSRRMQDNHRQAIEDYTQALRIVPDWALVFALRGSSHQECEHWVEAVADFRKAIELQPGEPDWHNDLGIVLRRQGDSAGAVEEYTRAIELAPDRAGFYRNRALAYGDLKDCSAQLSDREQAVRLDPENPEALNDLAWHLATCPDARYRDGQRALALAQRANELSGGGTPAMLSTLGAVHAELGDFEKAIALTKKALSRPERLDERTEAEIRASLADFEAGRPTRA